MKQFWQIVPTGDGYTYMGYEDGKIVPHSKTENRVDITLLWEHKSNCETYIRNHLDPTKYNAEEVFLDEKYYGINKEETTN